MKTKNFILVVDDDKVNISLLTRMLTKTGYEVRGITDVEFALQSIRKDPPDLILLDINMPKMDGFEACKLLKKDSRTEEIPVIFISALTEEDDKIKGFQAGGVDYITKPFRLGEVRARVSTHLDLRNSHQQLKDLNKKLEDLVEQRTASLKKEEKMTRAIFDRAPVGIALISSQTGQFIKINQSYCNIVEYSREEMLERSFADITLPEEREADLENIRRLRDGEIEIFSKEDRFLRKNGSKVWVKLTVVPLRQDNEKPEFHIAIVSNITERKKAEKELRKNEERLRAISDYAYDWETWTGPDGELIWTNPAVERISGYSREEYLNLSKSLQSRLSLIIHPEDYEKLLLLLQEGLEHKKYANDVRFRIKTKDNTIKWCSISFQPIYRNDGEFLGLRSSVRDISERKTMEEEARLHQQQLIQADKMISLGILVSGIAHEINNPNHFIMSHIAPLKNGWKGVLPILDRYFDEHGDFKAGGLKYSELREKLPAIFANIVGGTQRIKSIVDELRDYARERPADFTTTIQINNVVKSALILVANLLKKCTNNLQVTYGEDIPPLKGDYHRLEQVMVNLLQNSCQALPDMEAGISIATWYDQTKGCVIVEVKDQGAGINPDDMSHILDPFFTTKRDIDGTGLGLSISASIVADHGGNLKIESTHGKGATASIILPLPPKERPGFVERRKSGRDLRKI